MWRCTPRDSNPSAIQKAQELPCFGCIPSILHGFEGLLPLSGHSAPCFTHVIRTRRCRSRYESCHSTMSRRTHMSCVFLPVLLRSTLLKPQSCLLAARSKPSQGHSCGRRGVAGSTGLPGCVWAGGLSESLGHVRLAG